MPIAKERKMSPDWLAALERTRERMNHGYRLGKRPSREEIYERARAVGGSRLGIESMKRGEGRPAKEVFEKIRLKYKIPRDA